MLFLYPLFNLITGKSDRFGRPGLVRVNTIFCRSFMGSLYNSVEIRPTLSFCDHGNFVSKHYIVTYRYRLSSLSGTLVIKGIQLSFPRLAPGL